MKTSTLVVLFVVAAVLVGGAAYAAASPGKGSGPTGGGYAGIPVSLSAAQRREIESRPTTRSGRGHF